MAYITTSTSLGFHPIATLQNFARRIEAARQRRAVYHRTRSELMALTNRDLADLGLNRSEIDRVALDAAIGSAH